MKARPADGIVCRRDSAAGLHASRDSLYRITRDERQCRAGVIPLELLPRHCPLCGDNTIIGHGRRLRQVHDDLHERMWVRRGICHACSMTFTVLPDWLVPSGHFSVFCRQQACERITVGDSLEQAPPQCKDPSRLPDASSLRRWAHCRLLSIWCWMKAGVHGDQFLRAPTIAVWNFEAFCRILPVEARSP